MTPIFLPILSGMPQPQHIDGLVHGLVTQLVLPNQDPPHLARLELEQLLTDARVGQKDRWGFSQCLYCPRGGRFVHWGQKFVQARQVGVNPRRFAGLECRDLAGVDGGV